MRTTYFSVFYTIVVLMIISQRVASLSCYTCTSEDSWEDCNRKMTKTGCPSGAPNCAKGNLTCTVAGRVVKKVFYKRCGTQGKTCLPENQPSCPAFVFSYKWESICCTGKNCNSAPREKVSGVLTGLSICLVLWSP